MEEADDHGDLITKVADSFMNLGHYEFALKYYFMLEGKAGNNNVSWNMVLILCFVSQLPNKFAML